MVDVVEVVELYYVWVYIWDVMMLFVDVCWEFVELCIVWVFEFLVGYEVFEDIVDFMMYGYYVVSL